MNPFYAKGRRFEHKVRDLFESQGYFVARQAKSSFPDLIALKPQEVVFIECKAGGSLPKNDRIKIQNLRQKLNSNYYKLFVATNNKGKVELEQKW